MRQSYKEVQAHMRPVSFLSYIDNKIAAYLVYTFQNLPLTANFITFFSFLLVLAADFFLLVFNFKILFILLLITAYTFDNVDGTWARLKNQTSEFGGFFDHLLDEVKDYLIDLSFIIFYFNNINSYIADQKLILIAVSLYFIWKGLFYILRDHNLSKISANSGGERFRLFRYSGAEKFVIVYPLLSFNFIFFVIYIIGYLLLYFVNIFINLYKLSSVLSNRL